MNTILEKLLDLKDILKSFNELEKKYNWLLTDLDGIYHRAAFCLLSYIFNDERFCEGFHLNEAV